MNRWTFVAAGMLLLAMAGIGSTGSTGGSYDYSMDGDGTLSYPNSGWVTISSYDHNTSGNYGTTILLKYIGYSNFALYVEGHGSMSTSGGVYAHNNRIIREPSGTLYEVPGGFSFTSSYSGAISGYGTVTRGGAGQRIAEIHQISDVNPTYPPNPPSFISSGISIYISPYSITTYTVSGDLECIDNVSLYTYINNTYLYSAIDTSSSYSFKIIDGESYRLVFSDGAYYDFTCSGADVVFDYGACIWVYGYTCGVDTIKLYKEGGGWVLDDTESQSTGYDVYEMQIVDGEDYKISFIDSTIDGDIVVHNQTFSCTGDHVHIDFDRCEWVYPPYPPAPPIPIYVWTGYDYNIVVFRDEHGNFIENSQLAIYDKTDNQYLQRWTDASDGYTLLGARFDTEHDVLFSLRTFDGVFTLDTTYPANGSAPVGEENITTTNWTIPIKYNLNVLPVDQYGASLFDVFCGLSEYTPLNPGAFWGMDLSDRGYVPVMNCSGFAMCDIIAEKEGYADYKVEALNWTSKSALVKDYRHNIVMEEV